MHVKDVGSIGMMEYWNIGEMGLELGLDAIIVRRKQNEELVENRYYPY